MSWYKLVTTLVSVYYRLMYKVELNGLENIPKQGGFLLCCNHKSNNDPPFLGSFIPIQIAFLAKKELFKTPIFGKVLKSLGAIPLDRNANDVTAIKISMNVMRGGKGLLVFPQGGRREEMNQKDFRPGSLMMAYRTKVPVVPSLIEGNYKFRSKIRINVGIPTSAEELKNIVESSPEDERNSILSKYIYNRISSLAKG